MAKTATKTNSKRRTSTKSMKKAGPSRKTKAAGPKRSAAKSRVSAREEVVTIDRRRSMRREDAEMPAEAAAAEAPKLERRQKVNRRRQIDPTTCERDYTDNEVEFMNALDDYKRKSGRMFPTCSEVLEVIHSLGYAKLSPSEMFAAQGTDQFAASAKPMPSDWSASGEVGQPNPVERSSSADRGETDF